MRAFTIEDGLDEQVYESIDDSVEAAGSGDQELSLLDRGNANELPTIGTQKLSRENGQDTTPSSDEELDQLLPVPRRRIATRPMGDAPASSVEEESQPSSASDEQSAFVSKTTDRHSNQLGEGVLLSNTAPALAVETKGPRKIVIGKPATYVVSVTNKGSVVAKDVEVDVSLPHWADVSTTRSSEGSAGVDVDRSQNSIVRWKLRQLGAGKNEELSLSVIPRESRPFDLGVQWTFAPPGTLAQIEVQEPKLHMTLTGAQDVLYGETKVYTITLSNPGTGDAENVALTLLPITPNSKVAGSRNLGTLKAGERQTIDIELTAQQAGRLQVRAHAYADGGLRTQAAQDVLVRRANLQVSAVGSPMKYAGTTAAYKIRIANTGDAAARNVMTLAVLPAGAQYVTSSGDGKFDQAKSQVQWQIGALRPGAVRILDMQCVLSSPGDNRLDIRTDASDDLTASKSVVTVVEALADLKLLINDPQGATALGTDAEYEVRIVNRGSKAAENVEMACFFSEGVEPVAIQGWRGEVATGQVVLDPVTRIDAGEEVAFKVIARASKPGSHEFQVELECKNPETKLAVKEWTKYYSANAGSEISAPSVSRNPQSSAFTETHRR